MKTSYLKDPTPYEEINKLLGSFVVDIQKILSENLGGIYLMGSLTYGDFNPNSSDIDLQVVINKQMTTHQQDLIKQLHTQIANKYQKWTKRLECSYTPLAMLANNLPPLEPRPYYGEDTFYPEAPYGNEWIINQYMLYQHGIALFGPDYKTLISPVNIVEVQKACIRDLLQEWQPKISDPEWLANSHYQSYLILNLCRILYTVMCSEFATKKVSSAWVKNHYAPQWRELIEAAENWQYGKDMLMQKDTVTFIKFTIKEISKLPLYLEVASMPNSD